MEQGEWIFDPEILCSDIGVYSAGYRCSVCGKDYFKVDRMNYCPNCGARMNSAVHIARKEQTMSNLKPCPFCGRVPIVENCKDFGYFVKCKCGIEQSTLYAQRCDAVRRWNTRKEINVRNEGEG